MDDSIAFNVIHSNRDFGPIGNVLDVVEIIRGHNIDDVHLNSTHGRGVVLRNFATNQIMPHELDYRLRPVKVFLNEPLKKSLAALGEREVYNEIIESMV